MKKKVLLVLIDVGNWYWSLSTQSKAEIDKNIELQYKHTEAVYQVVNNLWRFNEPV